VQPCRQWTNGERGSSLEGISGRGMEGVMLLCVTHGLDILSNNYCSLTSTQTFLNSESLDNVREQLWLSHEMFAASHQCLDILSINPVSVTLGLTGSEPTAPIIVRDKFGTVARSASESCFLV